MVPNWPWLGTADGRLRPYFSAVPHLAIQVPRSGQRGYHHRTEINKKIYRIGKNLKEQHAGMLAYDGIWSWNGCYSERSTFQSLFFLQICKLKFSAGNPCAGPRLDLWISWGSNSGIHHGRSCFSRCAAWCRRKIPWMPRRRMISPKSQSLRWVASPTTVRSTRTGWCSRAPSWAHASASSPCASPSCHRSHARCLDDWSEWSIMERWYPMVPSYQPQLISAA